MICSEFQKGRLKDMFCLFQDEESNTKVNFQSHIISRFAWSFCVFFKQKNAFQKTQLPWIHVVALTLQVSHIGLLTTPRRHWHVCPTAKKISLPDHPYLSLLMKIFTSSVNSHGRFEGYCLDHKLSWDTNRIPLNSIHTSTWHALIHWSLRIPGFFTWIHGWQESPLKSAHELSSKVDGTTFSVNVPTESLVSHSLYPTNRHVYFNTLVLCFNN